MHDLTDAEFEALTRRLGLDPAQFDLPELHDAYRRLLALMARLDRPDRPADAETLGVFDPTEAL